MNRNLLLGSLAAAGSILVTLGLTELVLRTIDYPPSNFSPWIRAADTAYRYAPDLDTRMRRAPEYDVRFETNALGLRDDEISETADGPRVMFIGDSFTSGFGVERGELFVDLVEADLGVDVVNAGVGGYEVIHQVQYLRERGRALAPDLVVYVLYLGNDLSRNDEWRETADGGLEAADRVYPVRVERELKLGRLIRNLRYRAAGREAEERGAWEPFPDYLAMCALDLTDSAVKDYEASRRELLELRDEVAAAGAELLVAVFSYRTAVDPVERGRYESELGPRAAEHDLDRPEREILAFLASNEIATVNLNDALRARYAGGTAPLYFEIDGHFTPEGHRVTADALLGALRPWVGRRP